MRGRDKTKLKTAFYYGYKIMLLNCIRWYDCTGLFGVISLGMLNVSYYVNCILILYKSISSKVEIIYVNYAKWTPGLVFKQL